MRSETMTNCILAITKAYYAGTCRVPGAHRHPVRLSSHCRLLEVLASACEWVKSLAIGTVLLISFQNTLSAWSLMTSYKNQ